MKDIYSPSNTQKQCNGEVCWPEAWTYEGSCYGTAATASSNPTSSSGSASQPNQTQSAQSTVSSSTYAAGEPCRDVFMCVSGACGRSEALEDSPFVCCASGQVSFESFSLRNVCTGLTSGAACNRNNNLCASGICGDDNLCLDEKLAAGESCRDDNMCVSGACGRSEALEDSPFVCCASGQVSFESFSLRNVCTGLTSGAACNRNNNLCASGICGNIPGPTSVYTCQPNQTAATASSNPTSSSGSASQPNQTQTAATASSNPTSSSGSASQPNQTQTAATASSNPTSSSGSASQPNQTQTAATASSNPTSSSGSASQPNQTQTAGSNPTSTGVYGTQITIGPNIAQDIEDLLLDDFSGDGRPDLITATRLSPSLNFVENEGEGLFGAPFGRRFECHRT